MTARRSSKPQPPPAPARTLVLDNGAYTIKAGFVAPLSNPPSDGPLPEGDTPSQWTSTTTDDIDPRVIPNCIARGADRKTYVGSELDTCRDFGEMAFRRPAEKGYIVSWEAQREIWDREFFDDTAPLRCDPAETRLILAEHAGNLPILQTNCDQMVFEEFGFMSYYRGSGASFNAYNDVQRTLSTYGLDRPAEIMLLIDSGYSHTTITPLLKGRPLNQAVRRLEVGGKFLTNYLTRMLSLRHYDMRNDTYIVNEMKEMACYVSLDFAGDLDKTWKGTRGERREAFLTGGGVAKDYVLPDFHTRTKGVVRDYDPTQTARSRKLAAQLGETSEDVLTLRNERFTIPEILFNPSDVGLQQPGIADVVWESLQALPIGLWPGLLANIVVVGGNSLFEGFVERLQDEIVQRVPDECLVRVARPEKPLFSTWHGAAQLARHQDIEKLVVTKQEYDEHGATWMARKFAAGLPP
ncbi:actin family [Microdochium trichocladiopsis]|uniref:Actin family n=1 Tax=Microdochium trichocladiopsis TaxID=1682393 RepID=A0A9P9BNF6_9PEZI|nr:actin family [Microdochium trichocladiopsis]KAH7020833.1 actin family [Microdochium trichocladiopsis]